MTMTLFLVGFRLGFNERLQLSLPKDCKFWVLLVQAMDEVGCLLNNCSQIKRSLFHLWSVAIGVRFRGWFFFLHEDFLSFDFYSEKSNLISRV